MCLDTFFQLQANLKSLLNQQQSLLTDVKLYLTSPGNRSGCRRFG